MASFAQGCCCGGDGGLTCPGSCSFASSYTVSQITGGYSYQASTSQYSGCGQTCSFVDHHLQISWVQLNAPTTMTRVTDAATGRCCYQGSGTLAVTGSLELTQLHTGGPPPCQDPTTETDTYYFAHDVPFTLTVTCTGPLPGCSRTPTTANAWRHTLHICDFPIVCNMEVLGGDCDTCPTNAPFSLRCCGGTVSYISDLGALPAVDQDSGCLGYWQAGTLCDGTAPYPAMASNAGTFGPFAIFLDEECSEQDPQDPCTMGIQTQCWLPHIGACNLLSSPWLCDLNAQLQSYCGSTDWSDGPGPGCIFDVIQSGCNGAMPWRYA